MKSLDDKSIDMVLTDPPYGTTACKWDTVIPFEPMWTELRRICKGPICLFGSQPFTSSLVMSNPEAFRYEWIWNKGHGANFRSLKYQPLEIHESICVFYKIKPKYYPVMEDMCSDTLKRMGRAKLIPTTSELFNHANAQHSDNYQASTQTYPKTIIKFKKERSNQFKKQIFHPTQKPVPLLEYLIKTYTLEGETVLDFTMGSGSTGVACKNLNRKFIGIEKDETYFEIAKARINGFKPSSQAEMAI